MVEGSVRKRRRRVQKRYFQNFAPNAPYEGELQGCDLKYTTLYVVDIGAAELNLSGLGPYLPPPTVN